jgi:hypothetical protein
MDNPKYIVCENQAYVFPPFVDHAQFAHRNNLEKVDIQGAGFVSFGTKGPSCYGNSISLNIASRYEQDTDILHKLFVLGDWMYR